jgi:hypothetical protein
MIARGRLIGISEREMSTSKGIQDERGARFGATSVAVHNSKRPITAKTLDIAR